MENNTVVLRTTVATIINMPNGTQWAFPSPDVDGSASWRLRYTEWQPTKEERLLLASILDAYTDLVYARNLEESKQIIKEIKKRMRGA